MQGTAGVKIVPRVIFELEQAGLKELLLQPITAASLLADLCKKHSFDGLVGSSTLKHLTCSFQALLSVNVLSYQAH